MGRFAAEGRRWAEQHLGRPLGVTSAIYARPPVDNRLSWTVRVAALAPLARYVDDFLGASRQGVVWTAGRLLDILTVALGFPVDPEKSADDADTLLVLGFQVKWSWARRLVRTRFHLAATVAKERQPDWSPGRPSCATTGRVPF